MKHTRQDIARYSGNFVNFLNDRDISSEEGLKPYSFQIFPIPRRSEYIHVLSVSHNMVTKALTMFYFVSGAGTPFEISFGARFSKPHIRVNSSDVFEGYAQGKADSFGGTEQVLTFSERDFRKIIGELERLAGLGK